MRREQALAKACSLLREQGKEESIARFLLMYLLDEKPNKFINKYKEDLTKEIIDKYFLLINEHIKYNKPLSHLVGFDYFYDRKFKVTTAVLSPRMETEELVYKVVDYIRSNNLNNIKILDLCTGSGIIAITLKKELSDLNINVTASDISDEALHIAKNNALYHKENIQFIRSNIFENIYDNFDIIVSNPPYISYDYKENMTSDVLDYDPHLALFAEEDGMYFYREILENAVDYLTNNGLIFFEIGYDQKEKLEKLAHLNNYDVNIYKDINGRDRIAKLKNKIN
ncbi:peptide chain release factor N(5)-glutamine methyltransferase [Gemella sp. GH3]|uniref:peptide chain release factor N(5)-glutamine methyltransferase n=1 Tax=unclassified Gemella TaxID=2624949 RepID=UPI0015D0342D|nr:MULTISPECIES: peptide chain release factor N(5)-glutamine methyltransferase [unclassified Gemella]MBF0713883.1 peptide chain release factor N(5)-glutamine methyltransferase [Gemella sp. GH3.1]NYS50835.1 peptide chain release factor N(5)-glutamine methyltransferase [Gemella sp. GH3]